MNRLFLRVDVDDLSGSVAFYRALFGSEPTYNSPDSAEWLLDDPGLDFVVSSRSAESSGISHLGLVLDDPSAAAALDARMAAVGEAGDSGTLTDPLGLVWENSVWPDPSQADPQDEASAFVHHRRTQRFLGRDTAYMRRPYGRL